MKNFRLGMMLRWRRRRRMRRVWLRMVVRLWVMVAFSMMHWFMVIWFLIVHWFWMVILLVVDWFRIVRL